MGNTYWPQIQAALKDRVGTGAYKNWIEPLRLLDVTDQVAQIEVRTNFIGDYVQRSFGDHLLREFIKHDPNVQRLKFTTAQQGQSQPSVNHKANDALLKQSTSAGKSQSGPTLNTHFTFDNFVVGDANRLVHSAARRVCDSTGVTFNPFYLHSPSGLGKTHLMHAIAWEIQSKTPDVKVHYLSAEQFMFDFVKALRNKDTHSFKALYRAVDVLMIDDIQFIIGKESTQEEFLHTFNALLDHGKQVIIAGNCAPFDMDGLDERIKNRLQMGLVVDIKPADYDLRLGILHVKARGLCKRYPKVILDDGVLEFIAQNICSNTRVLEGALHRIFAFGDVIARPVNVEMCREAVKDILRSADRQVSIDQVMREICKHYDLDMMDLISARRSRSISRPRQVAMYLSKQLTTRSLFEIGMRFGKRDHTTVIHAVKRIEELRAIDAQVAKDVDLLQSSLKS